MNRRLTDDELSMVSDVIASRMGLHFPVERWAMLNRNMALAAREFGFQDLNGFIQWLLSAPLNKEQTDILAAHLTISETYFWREPKVFTALTDFILPELIKSKGKEIEERSDEIPRSGKGVKSIRIWSAGCSTGEEPYSLAVMLHKTIPEIKDWNINILASDINPKALEKAATGIYGPWSFRNTPEWFKSRYFHDLGDRRFEIIPEIKKMVTFSCLSLVEISAISKASTMDIIFCRNVLMYFTKEWVNKISQDLFHCLSEDGWFVVSSSELSSYVFQQFTPVNFPGAVLYRKGKNGSAYSCNIPSDEIPEPLPDTAFLTTEVSPKMVVKEVAKVVAKEVAKMDPQSIVKTPEESYTDKLFAIRLLANLGHPAEALSICNEAIASYKLSSGLYFLRASILQELDKSSEAIASLKQAIYIDPDYIMGHFALGNIFIRLGKAKNAKRYFNNVLDLLSRCKRDDILPESEGLSVNYIRDIILTGLQTQESK